VEPPSKRLGDELQLQKTSENSLQCICAVDDDDDDDDEVLKKLKQFLYFKSQSLD